MHFSSRVLFLVSLAILSLGLLAPAVQAEPLFTMPSSGALGERGTAAGKFVSGGIEIACNETTYRGEAEGNSTILALEPDYGDCTAQALTGFPADFFQELCSYVLHDLERRQGAWEAAVDIRCEGEWEGIGWDFYETTGTYREARQFCSTRVPKQPDIGTAELRNLPGRKGIEIRWDLSGLEYTVARGNSFASSLLCGSMLGGRMGEASYSGTTRVFAETPTGSLEDLTISG